MKIAYFGLPLGALLLLEDGHDLSLVVLAPVEAPGRRRLRAAIPDALDTLGGELEDFDAEVTRRLNASNPDLLVSWFWTRKLPPAWLARARLGAIGAHPSLLPRHRGPNPFFWSIDAGDEVAGVTVHRLGSEYDTGAMLAASSVSIGTRDAWQLARALDRPSLTLLRETARRFADGQPTTEQAQEESLASWAPEPSGAELKADFGWATERVLRRIRALSPTPGLALEVLGTPLFVTRAEAQSDYVAALIPGEAHVSDDALSLRTGDGAVRVTRAFFPETEEEAASAADVVALLKRAARP